MSLPHAVTADGKKTAGRDFRRQKAEVEREFRRRRHELPADNDGQEVMQVGSIGTLEVICALCGCVATITSDGKTSGLALAGPCQGEAR